MKLRSAFIILACSLILGNTGPVFADDVAPTRSDQVTAIQNQYNPLFDAQYARLVIVKKKASVDTSMLRRVNEVLTDFLDMRRIIASGLSSATSDLVALKDFADEEAGEFASTVSNLETDVAKIKTITCIKGKASKKVSGLSPKCPTGYKKK